MRTADLGVRPLAELCVNVLKRVWPKNNKPYQDIYYDSETVSRPTDELGNQSFQTDQKALRFWETDEYSVQTLDVQGWLEKNLNNRCVAQVSEKPHVCSPLSVVSNSSQAAFGFELKVLESISTCS